MTTHTFRIMQVDQPTCTGRIYPSDELDQCIDLFDRRSPSDVMFGCIYSDSVDCQRIEPEQVSHTIDQIEVIGGWMYATINTVSTPLGAMLESIINAKAASFAPIFTARSVDITKTCYGLELVSVVAVANVTSDLH